MLAAQYHAVVANPPYMGSRRHERPSVKRFAKVYFATAFEERPLRLLSSERSYTLAKSAQVSTPW